MGKEDNSKNAAAGGREGASVQARSVRPISDEPLINLLHGHVIELTTLLYAAALVYMSFVPFDFVRHAHASGSGSVWGLALKPFNLKDILANLALYLPLGAGVYAVWRRRGPGRIISCLLTILTVPLVSFGIEFGQRWVASRVATWVDVASNSLGAALGMILVITGERQLRSVAQKARWAARRNWPLTLAKAAVCLLLLAQLRPFDVAIDLRHAAGGLRQANFSPLAVWESLPSMVAGEVKEGRRESTIELTRARWEYGLVGVTDVSAYAVVTFLLVAGLAAQGRRSPARYFSAGFVTILLAGMITVIRVFLISHGLDTAQLVCGVAGWAVGCVLAGGFLRNKANEAGEQPEGFAHDRPQPLSMVSNDRLPARTYDTLPLSARWRNAAVISLLALTCMYELVPFDFGTGAGGISSGHARRVCLVPFLAHFHARPNDAFYDLSGDLLRYAAFGLALAWWLRDCSRARWRRQLLLSVGVSALAACAFEGVHLFMASRQTDVTTILMALAGAFTGAVALRWTDDYRASGEPTVADDLLTRQLIEGETYKPLPVPKEAPKESTPQGT